MRALAGGFAEPEEEVEEAHDQFPDRFHTEDLDDQGVEKTEEERCAGDRHERLQHPVEVAFPAADRQGILLLAEALIEEEIEG